MSVLWRLINPKLQKQLWREVGACGEFQGWVIGDFPEPLASAGSPGVLGREGSGGQWGGTIEFCCPVFREDEVCLGKGLPI